MNAQTSTTKSPLRNLVIGICTLLLAAGVVFALSGCSASSSEARVAELEAEVERLQGELDTEQTDSTSSAAQTTADASSVQTSFEDTTVQDISDRAEDLITRAEAADVSSDHDTKIKAFFELDSEFNQLENELDAYEDQQEANYRSGSLTWDEYRAIEREIDQVEDRLDYAQDALELRFGIDD